MISKAGYNQRLHYINRYTVLCVGPSEEIPRERRSPRPLTVTLPLPGYGEATVGTGRSLHERCGRCRCTPCETSADSFPTTITAFDNDGKHLVDSPNEPSNQMFEQQQLLGLAMAGLAVDCRRRRSTEKRQQRLCSSVRSRLARARSDNLTSFVARTLARRAQEALLSRAETVPLVRRVERDAGPTRWKAKSVSSRCARDPLSLGQSVSYLPILTVFESRPAARDVYAWSRYTPLRDVKVVILGQDPYHDDGEQAGPGSNVPAHNH